MVLYFRGSRMEQLTWQLVVLIIGGLASFLSWTYAMIRGHKREDSGKVNSPSPSNNSTDTADKMDLIRWRGSIEAENMLIREQLLTIKNEIKDLRKSIDHSDEQTLKSLERFENRISKFTDIIIEYMQHNKPPKL